MTETEILRGAISQIDHISQQLDELERAAKRAESRVCAIDARISLAAGRPACREIDQPPRLWGTTEGSASLPRRVRLGYIG